MKKVIIFASGSGTNAQRIIEFSRTKESNFSVEEIFCNNPNAFVINRATTLNIPHLLFDKTDFNATNNTSVYQKIIDINPDLIVLAGFLWLIPSNFIQKFPQKIINIHPALLPKYGGKGMYGERVHEAVIKQKEKESGITIHYVSEKYDEGDIIAQYKCDIIDTDDADTLAQKIHILEHKWFPIVINNLCNL